MYGLQVPTAQSLLAQTIHLGCQGATSCWLAQQVDQGRFVVIVADDGRAIQLQQQLRAWRQDWPVAVLLADSHVPFAEVAFDGGLQLQQDYALRYRWCVEQQLQGLVISAPALLHHHMPHEEFLAQVRSLTLHQQVDRSLWVQQLLIWGFQANTTCTAPGSFAIRGGLLDLWPPHMPFPVRLDFFGDQITSMVGYDAESHQLLEPVGQISLYPIDHLLMSTAHCQGAVRQLKVMASQAHWPSKHVRWLVEQLQEHRNALGWRNLWPLAYGPSGLGVTPWWQGASFVLVEHRQRCQQSMEATYARLAAAWQHQVAQQRPIAPLEMLIGSPEQALAPWPTDKILWIEPTTNLPQPHVAWQANWHDGPKLSQQLLQPSAMAHQEQSMLQPLLQVLGKGATPSLGHFSQVVLMTSSLQQAETLGHLLMPYLQDKLPIVPELQATFQPPSQDRSPTSIWICSQHVGSHLVLPDAGWMAIDCRFLWPSGNKGPRNTLPARQETRRIEQALNQFAPGDTVIHREHGVGRYQGCTRLHIDGIGFDALKIIYHGGDILYVPVFNILLLTPYKITGEVRLDTLGSQRWLRARKQVETSVLQLAHQLLRTQAQRQHQHIEPLKIDHELLAQFAADFPYEPTPDQARAIGEVLQDMAQTQPMDRLIIGDVGFGKTEVALRAAFATVSAGKQVVVLAPTTVLAEQHGQTFSQRMAGYGIQVGTMSRCRTSQAIRQTLATFAKGRLDVLVGTHRLLSLDVGADNIGLVVVDEEQRFGVRQKERIKALGHQAHLLTLSATPIPRTLHMAMAQLRQISLIQTPPPHRASIQTEIIAKDEGVLRQAIARELARGGQVYCIHHRIAGLTELDDWLGALLPQGARLATLHGQMDSQAIERTMVDFVQQKIQVLLATAIVENGLDIPAANTMLIFDAHHFGLAQLHQLRGRIGRGDQQAYAYLIVPHMEQLPQSAMVRLTTLQRFSALGSGFTLATYDLDQRGYGDLLGEAQSGHIQTVGLILYGQLLQETLESLQQGRHAPHLEPELHLPITAVLPESYVPDAMQRLQIYQQMATAPHATALEQQFEQMQTLYGEAPEEVRHFYGGMQLRLLAMDWAVIQLVLQQRSGMWIMVLRFADHHRLDVARLQQLSQSSQGKQADNDIEGPILSYRFLADGRLQVSWPMQETTDPAQWVQDVMGVLRQLPKESPT